MIQNGQHHIEVRMTLNQKDKLRLLTELSRWKGAIGTATARAINKASTSTRTYIARSVTQYIKVKYGAVLRRITINKANKRKLFSSIYISKRRLNPMDVTGTKETRRVKATRKKDGSSYRKRPTGGGVSFNTPNRKFVKGAFIANTNTKTKKGNDIKGVFVRTGRFRKVAVQGKRGTGMQRREIIHMLKTGSPFIYWRNEAVMAERTDNFASAKLSEELNRQIDLFLDKKGIVTGKQVA